MKIPFHQPCYGETEVGAVTDALINGTDCRAQAEAILAQRFPNREIFLTSSGSAAFELLFAALALETGVEVIMPSFTFPSCASTALRMGLRPVFTDISADTKALDITDVERRITARTRCVAVTHYGGSSPDMDALRERCENLMLIEDAALSFGTAYRSRPLGAIGDFGILSFHETKNISAGEGGALLVDPKHAALINKLQVIYDNGTDKAAFRRGEVTSYTWQAAGMNVAMSNLNAALLCAQLERADEITEAHRRVCAYYHDAFSGMAERYGFNLPYIPPGNTDNGHVFYLVFADHKTRETVRAHLESQDIGAFFHYMPLHASAMGHKLGYASGDLPVTQRVSECLLRLPVWAGLCDARCDTVIAAVKEALCR